MNSNLIRLPATLVVAALFLAGSLAHAQTPAPAAAASSEAQQPLKIRKIRGDIYEVEGKGGNAVVYATPAGVVLVDDKNNGDAIVDELLALIRTVTDQPVKYVINTHYHQDHIGNNGRFIALGAKVVAQENTKAYFAGPVWETTTIYDLDGKLVRTEPYSKGTAEGKWKQVPPNVTFKDDYSISLGGRTVRVRYFGPAHTGGDAFVFFPAEKVLASGDTVRTPFCSVCVDYHAGGSLKGYIQVLDSLLQEPKAKKIAQLDAFDIGIPGHGDVTDVAGLRTHRDKLVKLRDDVVNAKHAGKTYRQVAEALVAEYGWKDGDRNIGQWTFPGIWKEYP